jgi:hypothetical protein
VDRNTLNKFLTNWKISGYPKNLITNVTMNKSANFARRFLNTKLQAGRNKAPQERPYGSKFPNKHPWKNIINSMNKYNLTNAQKNMLRRVNIAVAAQNKKGMFERRASVNFNIKNLNRNQAIQKQKNALNKARQTRQRQRQVEASPNANGNTFYNAKQTFNNNKNQALQTARQHREAFGN